MQWMTSSLLPLKGPEASILMVDMAAAKAASFIYGSTFGTLIQVTGHISVAAAGGINHFSGFVGRYFMECLSIVYNRAQAAPT